MSCDKASWPLIVGITAGVVGGIVAGAYLHARAQSQPEKKLLDAQDIIALCEAKIHEIESGLEAVRQS